MARTPDPSIVAANLLGAALLIPSFPSHRPFNLCPHHRQDHRIMDARPARKVLVPMRCCSPAGAAAGVAQPLVLKRSFSARVIGSMIAPL
jgi:hypothetical protein